MEEGEQEENEEGVKEEEWRRGSRRREDGE